jgi:hypothetical protein
VSEKFYAEELSIVMLIMSYKMLLELSACDAAKRSRCPSLYLNGTSKCGVRLFIENRTVPFGKGVHLCMWMRTLVH